MPKPVAEPWRLRCPEGHTSITHRRTGPNSQLDANHYYCQTCATGGTNPRHDHAVDVKTEREVPA